MKKWVIWNKTKDLFWNANINEWVKSNATHYSLDEINSIEYHWNWGSGDVIFAIIAISAG